MLSLISLVPHLPAPFADVITPVRVSSARASAAQRSERSCSCRRACLNLRTSFPTAVFKEPHVIPHSLFNPCLRPLPSHALRDGWVSEVFHPPPFRVFTVLSYCVQFILVSPGFKEWDFLMQLFANVQFLHSFSLLNDIFRNLDKSE